MIATLYSTVDGHVIEVFAGNPEWIVLNLDENEALTDGDHLGKRIDLQTGQPLPLINFNLSISANTVSGIPPGTKATIRGEVIIINDGVLELQVNLPATIPVTLNHPLYEEETVEVACEAQD